MRAIMLFSSILSFNFVNFILLIYFFISFLSFLFCFLILCILLQFIFFLFYFFVLMSVPFRDVVPDMISDDSIRFDSFFHQERVYK